MKGVNLNAFNEKLLHRYLLESLYGLVDDSTNIKRKLLPKSKHNMLKKINLIVPESNKAGVRPDLELFFKDTWFSVFGGQYHVGWVIPFWHRQVGINPYAFPQQ